MELITMRRGSSLSTYGNLAPFLGPTCGVLVGVREDSQLFWSCSTLYLKGRFCRNKIMTDVNMRVDLVHHGYVVLTWTRIGREGLGSVKQVNIYMWRSMSLFFHAGSNPIYDWRYTRTAINAIMRMFTFSSSCSDFLFDRLCPVEDLFVINDGRMGTKRIDSWQNSTARWLPTTKFRPIKVSAGS